MTLRRLVGLTTQEGGNLDPFLLRIGVIFLAQSADLRLRTLRCSSRCSLAAVAGHAAIYALMIFVPAVRILAAAGGTRGLSYLGLQIVPPRETAIAWTQPLAEWHGEAGWILAALVLGHIAMAVGWHRMVKRDGVLSRMA